jgi:hypothetical protein
MNLLKKDRHKAQDSHVKHFSFVCLETIKNTQNVCKDGIKTDRI